MQAFRIAVRYFAAKSGSVGAVLVTGGASVVTHDYVREEVIRRAKELPFRPSFDSLAVASHLFSAL